MFFSPIISLIFNYTRLYVLLLYLYCCYYVNYADYVQIFVLLQLCAIFTLYVNYEMTFLSVMSTSDMALFTYIWQLFLSMIVEAFLKRMMNSLLAYEHFRRRRSMLSPLHRSLVHSALISPSYPRTEVILMCTEHLRMTKYVNMSYSQH